MTRVLSAVAWPYTNGPRHIGHVAGFGVPSDVFSRFMRMAGHDVLMVSGTDEHGTPILVTGRQRGRARPRAGRQVQPGDRRRPLRPRPVVRPLHPHHHRQPLRAWCRRCSRPAAATATWSSRRRRPPSAPRPGAPCPTATSRAPAPSAGTPRRAATSATTAATSSTRPTSSTRGPRSTGRPRSSGTPSTGSSTCPRSPRRWGSGSTSARPPACGGPTSSSSARTSSRRSGRGR